MHYAAVQVRRYLREQQESGLAVTEYYRRNEVNVWTFRGWRKCYRGNVVGTRMPFLRLDVAPLQKAEVVTGCRSSVRIPLVADREALQQVHWAVRRSRLA